MKRIIAGILAFFYLLLASGVGISIHYCMGNQAGTEYTYHADRHCQRCGMEKKQGCCHDDYKLVKISDDQQTSKVNNTQLQAPVTDLTIEHHSFVLPEQGNMKKVAACYHAPPDLRGSEIYRYNQVFRI